MAKHWLKVALRGVVVASVLGGAAMACGLLAPNPVSDGGAVPSFVYVETWDAGSFDTDGAPPSATPMACGDAEYGDPWTPGYPATTQIAAQTKVTQLLPSMQLSDMAGQMRGTNPANLGNYYDIFRTLDNQPLGIKGFLFRDGPRGVCLSAQLPANKAGYSTAFPVPEARAASFDLALEEQIAEDIGDEVLASGNTMILAPVVNLLRHPFWGRAQETYGEDTYVLGRMGSAFVTGAQKYLPACVKHYAAYNIEDGRAYTDSVMKEETLREKYVRQFGMIVRDTGVACVMAAYNSVNGTKSTQNAHLLTDILRGDFNYQGFVLSDWWAMPPGGNFATTDALKGYASQAANAGMDMELPWAYNYAELESITGPLPDFPVETLQVTTSASRILEQKFRFNVESTQGGTLGLKTPTTTIDENTGSIVGNDAHVLDAERAALEGTVLLKNDNNVLPIDSTKVHTIAVVGGKVPWVAKGTLPPWGTVDFARTFLYDNQQHLVGVLSGDLGSSRVFPDPAKSVGAFDGIKNNAPAGVTVVAGNSAAEVPSNADLIVAVVGLTPEDEGEEYTQAGDRTTLDLDGKPDERDANGNPIQNPLMTALIALGKPIVVIVEGGAPVNMPWLSQVQAVVMAWYPGQHGGTVLGEQLFGKANFSGKLPMTWPAKDADLPQWEGPNLTTTMDFYTGYQYYEQNSIKPLYAFGSGMSYTTFAYSNLYVPCTTVTPNGVVYATADVTNTGTVAGDEVAFLFLTYPPERPQPKPVREVAGFYRVSLMPGETKRVTFPIRVADLKYWDKTFTPNPDNTNANAGWVAPAGTFSVQVGPSYDNLPLTGTFTVQ